MNKHNFKFNPGDLVITTDHLCDDHVSGNFLSQPSENCVSSGTVGMVIECGLSSGMVIECGLSSIDYYYRILFGGNQIISIFAWSAVYLKKYEDTLDNG